MQYFIRVPDLYRNRRTDAGQLPPWLPGIFVR